MTAEAVAPAKVNLCLHVTGRRADGFHDLDSLVAFAGIGDRITVRPARDWRLTVTGPMAQGVPTGEDNLALRAARLTLGPPAAITLDKHLPAAAGLGGGSSDAAATLRALRALDGRPLPERLETLGADIPVCLGAAPARVQGIGESLSESPALPPLHLCLINPRIAVPTADVFAALTRPDNAPLPPRLPGWPEPEDFTAWLRAQRNDLETPARGIAPAIGVALARLGATEGCHLARMSGSGATCFGLYNTAPEAETAATAIRRAHPRWWVAAAPLLAAPPSSSSFPKILPPEGPAACRAAGRGQG